MKKQNERNGKQRDGSYASYITITIEGYPQKVPDPHHVKVIPHWGAGTTNYSEV